MKKLSIIIPVFNERRTLYPLVSRVIKAPSEGLKKEIIIVDDGSTDGTRDMLTKLQKDPASTLNSYGISKQVLSDVDIVVYLKEKNEGKASAVNKGIELSTGDIILFQDADLEYDPNDYPKLLRPILSNRADVVYGSRFIGDERAVLLFWHSIGNKLLTTLSNMFTDLNLTDMETCYKAFRAHLLKEIQITSKGFGIEPEITAKIARLGYRIYEVPISYHGRSYAEGKKIGLKDAIEAFYYIIKYNLFDNNILKTNTVVETLAKMSEVEGFNRHIYETLRPYLGKNILEVGAGTGNITKYLLDRANVVATDVDPIAVQYLKDHFSEIYGFSATVFDLAGEIPDELKSQHFDSVVCLNVLEHVKDHKKALKNIHQLLKATKGRLLLLVPAHSVLYSKLDENIGHFRRYDKDELLKLIQEQGFSIEIYRPFNFAGLLGWLLNGRILKRDKLPTGQLKLYQLLSPVLTALDSNLGKKIGLSHFVVARAK